MQEYKKIPVTPEVYEQVQVIASTNGRNLGAQVAHWVKQTCRHPLTAREYFDLQITYPENTDIVPAHGFKCNACGRLVITGVLAAELEEEE